MDTIKSFKGYGKVDPLEEQAFKRKTRKRLIIVAVSLVVLAALIVGVVVGTVVHKRNNNKGGGSGGVDYAPPSTSTPAQSLKAICSVTNYPGSCYASISELKNSNTSDPERVFRLSLQVALDALQKVSTMLPEKWSNSTKDPGVKKALGVCQTVFDDAIDMLNDSISTMDAKDGERLLTVTKISDLKTWLSTTLTDQDTCLDALEESNATIIEDVKDLMNNSTEYVSNSLAIVSKILGILGRFKIPVHRKLLGTAGGSNFPEWVRATDRKLLQQNSNPKPDVVVAKDGTGDVTTIKEAIAKVPKKSATRFIIYVKAGEYGEQLILDKSFWNLMIYGDGKEKTIISFDDNFIDGTRTFDTATFAIAGRNFIAKDLTFKNTAGASKHQAVAVRSGSDRSVFYRCSFDGYQDTLYAHSNRQFYRECDITGTIDFIFGNAAVVFQNCNILPRQPMPNQFVTITAQGKKDPNQNTGISIQNCVMSPLDNLTAPTYLGRPWKNFSTTVIMSSQIGAFLAPKGWIEWTPNVEPPNSIFYAEYQNIGPGSGVDQRVKWAGFKPTISSNQASQYTVQSFIQGDVWLPETQVTFT